MNGSRLPSHFVFENVQKVRTGRGHFWTPKPWYKMSRPKSLICNNFWWKFLFDLRFFANVWKFYCLSEIFKKKYFFTSGGLKLRISGGTPKFEKSYLWLYAPYNWYFLHWNKYYWFKTVYLCIWKHFPCLRIKFWGIHYEF